MASMSIRIRILLSSTKSALPPFSGIHFSSHTISPSPSPSPQSPIPLFLLTECHFSHSHISKIMQCRKSLSNTRSPHTAREAVEFLKQCGFTQSQLHTVILKSPAVLAYKVDTLLKPKFHYFQTLGFTDQDLINLISIQPSVLGLSLDSNLIPKISFLESLFGAKSNLIKALKRSSALLVDSIEKQLKPKLDLFEQWGIRGELLSRLISTDSDILVRYSIESLRVKMEYARNTMGFVQGSKAFVYAIIVLIKSKPQTIEKKMKHLQCLGFLEDEVHEVLKKLPMLLTCSTKKMQENMDFLTQTAGLNLSVVFSNPNLLQYSVKKRLMPRHAIFKALNSEHQSVPSLQTIFGLSERKFLEKIVECNPQASMLKEVYEAKMECAGVRLGRAK